MLRWRKGPIEAWFHRILLIRNLAMTSVAMMSRRMGHRAILLVGVGATIYAGALFITDQIAPGTPSASHDAILKGRWASPEPSRNIVIVDIDERSLAALAPEHGRWPWPRLALADGLDRLSQAGVEAVLFNVLLSDPDKTNPDSDAAMEAAAALVPAVAYPLIRLNPDNDVRSALKVSDLFARTGDRLTGPDGPVAVLLPMFEPMLSRSGVANQMPDGDGIVRRYPVIWSDPALKMPSIAARTLMLSGNSVEGLPATITLNWRNKSGRYTRVSFSDLLTADMTDPKWSVLKRAVVVLGVSAPGLGQVKPTAARATEDDSEILATALDDMLNDTHLRVTPAWLVLLLEVAVIWILVWIGIGQRFQEAINKIFVLMQSGAASVMMVSASYSNYLIDLSAVMGFGAGIFGIIKLVQSLDSGWSRARPGWRYATPKQVQGVVLLVGYLDSQLSLAQASALQSFLESRVGLPQVIRVDDLFGGESFVRKACEDFSCQLCWLGDSSRASLLSGLAKLPFHSVLNVREVPLVTPWEVESHAFRLSIAPHMLRQCADIILQSPESTASRRPSRKEVRGE